MTVANAPAPLWSIPMASMTPLERVARRFMRAPDHPAAEADDNDVDSDEGEDHSGSQSRDTTDHGEADEEDADTDHSEGSGDDDGGKRNRPNGFEKRINTLTRRNRELEARLREADNGKRDTTSKDTPRNPEEKPKVADFDSYEDFIEAVADYKAEQRIKASRQEEEATRSSRDFAKRMTAGMKKFADYDDVVTDDVKIDKAAVAAIKETDDPAGIIYYLCKNPDEADAINDMTPGRQAIAIGKLAAKLETATPPKKSNDEGEGARRRTAAPEPITPTRGGKGSTEADYDKMSASDFIKHRNAEVRKGR